MVRSMELLLGLPPMSQFDAAAMLMFASFGTTPVVKPFNEIAPQVDLNAKNTKNSVGAKESSKMDFSGVDRAAHARTERNYLEECKRERFRHAAPGASLSSDYRPQRILGSR